MSGEGKMNRKSIAIKIERLHDTVLELSRAKTNQEVYQITVHAAEKILDYIICAFDIAYGKTLHTVAKSSQIPDDHVQDFDINEGVIGRTFREKRTIICSDLACDPDAKPVKADLFRSAISAPIGNVGVFQAVSEHADGFTANDIKLVEILLAHTAEALQRIHLIGELERMATIDSLTGALNRNMMLKIIEREIESARRSKRCLGIVMLDMNGLKGINDVHGHLFGDRAIRICAQLIGKAKRLSDILFRYGGDEFLLLMPQDLPDPDPFVKRLHNSFDEYNRTDSPLPFPISVSSGYAYWLPGDSIDPEDLINKADAIMYEEKKNRVG